jgi:hypothetical protein
MMIGTILISAVILISGSAVATWIYASSVYSDEDCENSEEALGAPDEECATVGTNDPDPTIGDLWLDFGFAGISNDVDIYVYGDAVSNPPEYYTVYIYNNDLSYSSLLGSGQSDQTTNYFDTGSPNTGFWEFIRIIGTSGSTSPSDPIYGPEIDAVGYDSP